MMGMSLRNGHERMWRHHSRGDGLKARMWLEARGLDTFSSVCI